MKTIALILMVIIAGCEYTPNNSNNPTEVTSDVPCIKYAPITGWAGEYKQQGKGQWYYYSIVDDCN